MEVKFYDTVDDSLLKFAVVWILFKELLIVMIAFTCIIYLGIR